MNDKYISNILKYYGYYCVQNLDSVYKYLHLFGIKLVPYWILRIVHVFCDRNTLCEWMEHFLVGP